MDSSVDASSSGWYVGLPLAREASAAGLTVIGLDISSEVIERASTTAVSTSTIYADSDVAEMLRRGFFATIDAASYAEPARS